MIKTIQSPHDKFFKASMSDLRVAKDFFDFHLLSSIKQTVQLDTLTVCKGSFVDQNLAETATDMLFAVDFSDQPGYLYVLIEHQSKPDKLMPFRMLKYIVNIMDQHLKSNQQQVELPVVYPLLFYTGLTPYNYSTDIFDLFNNSREVAKQTFLQPFQLLQVNQIADDLLRERVWSGIMELCMKHVLHNDILPYFKDMLSLLQKIEKIDGDCYVQTILTYLWNTAEISDKQAFIQLIQQDLSPEMEAIIMTPAQYFKEEGKMDEKRITAKRMLDEGFPVEKICKITELSLHEIESLANDSMHS